MKLAVSQIAFAPEEEQQAFGLLHGLGFAGLEIAPTRVAGPQPYSSPDKAAAFALELQTGFGLAVCSMQSIWYGQTGNMFGAQRQHLLQYTKAAIKFARAAACPNLVFGSPKNRVLPQGQTEADALPFFAELAAFAHQNGCVLALEATPPVYGTNFMNTTAQALAMVKQVNHPGCKLNLDFGTVVINEEDLACLQGQVQHIHHVHISEPQLAMVQPRAGHKALAALLKQEGYAGYVSIEMKQQPLAMVQKAAEYVAEVFA